MSKRDTMNCLVAQSKFAFGQYVSYLGEGMLRSCQLLKQGSGLTLQGSF